MKFLRTILKSVPLCKPQSFIQKKPLQTLSLTSGTLLTAYWFSQKKILNDNLLTIETDDNLGEGEMKEVQVGPKLEDTVLLIKHQGKVYCTQSKCSHFGFSLVKGSLFGDKVICPLHNAGFSIKTGQPDQGPVFGGLKTFPVEVSSGKIKIQIPQKGWDAPPPPITVNLSKLDKNKRIVIVGAGPAALSAIDTLRQTGYDGFIYMVTKEQNSPYDRTLLSKMSDAVKKPSEIRTRQYYQENGVILMTQRTVTSIDYLGKKVMLSSKQEISYDKLLLATGCINRVPPIKGIQKVKYLGLRSLTDYEHINKAVRQNGVKNVTIIGGGFIGMQIASALKAALKDQINVTILESANVPLQHVLGEEVGQVMKDLGEKNGVKIITSAKISEITSQLSQPKSVKLDNQQILTDVLIMATGVRPAVDYAPQLVEKQNNGIKTNVFLQTNQKDVYAAGDIATYPYWYTGGNARIEHYNEAIYQGSVAALNMAGKKFPMDNIPYFWTRSFNNSLSFTGYAKGWDHVHISGSLKQMKFIAYYVNLKQNKVLGAAVMNMPNQVQIVNQAMRNGVMPSATTIMQTDFQLQSLLPEIKAKNPKCTRCTKCQV